MLNRAAIAVLTFLLSSIAAEAAEPVRLSLDGDWGFTYTGSSTADVPDLPQASDFDCTIAVPGRWDDQLDRFKQAKWWPHAVFRTSLGPMRYLSGIGWHRKAINVPPEWANRVATITIGGAVGTTHAWLNGRHLGSNQLTVYAPFELDLTGKLLPGKANELIIAVDNSPRNVFGGWAFLGNAGMASGLARSVSLAVAAGSGRVADLYVRPGVDLKEVVWTAELSTPQLNAATPPSKLQWLVRDFKSNREFGRGEVEVPSFTKSHLLTWTKRFQDIKPWSDREPNLYRTELRWVTADGQLWDVMDQRFGLRRWSYEGRKLFLNGQPHYLRLEFGAYYFPIDGAVSTSKDYWLNHMKCVKELGLNGINFAAQVCPVEMMEVADELGIILQCGDETTFLEDNNSRYRMVWEPIVKTTRRYPSVAIYGFGGEHKYYEGMISQSKLQFDLIKSLHPDSLVMPQQAIHGIDYGVEDNGDPGVKHEPFLHHAERLARYTTACDLFGHYSGGAFSHSYFNVPWRDMEARFKVYDKPIVAHELFISASYLSPKNPPKYTGRIPPYIYSRLEKELKESDLIDKWPAYFDHTSRLQHLCRKYCMEKVRKCDGLAGFELLGMMDMHFVMPEYAVGVVDEFLDLKPGDTIEGIRRYSDESVLLLDFDNGYALNHCYWADAPFEANVMASLFGPTKLEQGSLKWALNDGDKTILEGSVQLSGVPNGEVSTLKKLKLKWPEVQQTTRLKLSTTLSGSGYSLANDWNFWVFPKKTVPQVIALADEKALDTLQGRYPGVKALKPNAKEKLRIVSKLSADDVKHLDQGDDILLLGAEPFTEYAQWPYFYPAKGYRPFSNGGAIIADHPVFRDHPNEGWNDWLFCPLMQGAKCILFDGTIDMTFDPIFEIISSAGHVRKQALMFEQRVGKGRLLVSTLFFDMGNPSCVTMMDSLLRYVQSDEFQPKHSVEIRALMGAMIPQDNADNRLKDGGFEKSGHWVTDDGDNQIDGSTAHGGHRSLRLVVTERDLQQNSSFVSSVSAREITFQKNPRRLKLSGWFKTRMQDSGAGPRVFVTLRYEDVYKRSATYAIEMKEPADDWRYAEKTFDVDGTIVVANAVVELAGAPGTSWIDDLYFGEDVNDLQASATNQVLRQANGASQRWQKDKISRKFKAPVWYRIDDGDWMFGDTVEVDREGAHKLFVKKTKDDPKPEVYGLLIDLTPPTVTLKISPPLEQEAGLFTSTRDAEYTVTADDGLSGVKLVEFATDGKAFIPYKTPFKLPPGKHEVICRATDRSGNVSRTMTGDWITGSERDTLEIEVR